ncbi:hypothetical protein CesoFtcFv8_002881 [Champsocephalus esox]|uniref:Uncharacterized protein n=1 Tax=Champsocephalus esox TaxID=159716 RepID=A0AAN8CYP6_9TELE|nr:hypothetical protein CesoFtcFv8_002881 [Champsocephalus esox]
MTPHVTNQADKEQGLLRADAQLWLQLCVAVRARNRKRGEGETGRETKQPCRPGRIHDQSIISDRFITLNPQRLYHCVPDFSFSFLLSTLSSTLSVSPPLSVQDRACSTH